MNIAELFARIGLKTDEDKAKSFGRAMTTVKVGLIATTAAAAAAAVAINKITFEAREGASAFKQFETETGASAQELQKWQSVAEQTNQSAESVSSAIKAIVSNQEKIKLGQGDISGYQLLGIDPRQDPFKILEELREKSKGLSDGMKKNILSQIGVGAGLLQTLNLTRKEFDEMAGRAWIISPQAIETLTKAKASIDLAVRSIRYMKAQIAVGLAPQIRKVTKDFQAFMKANEKGIIEGFKLGFKYVTMFVKAIYNAGSMLNRFIKNTIGWENAMKGLLGVIIALNAAFLLSPLGLFMTGIILLVAVLDDLYVYSQGGKSLFGNMMKEFPALEKTLFGSFKVIKDVFELIKAFGASDEATIKKITDEWGLFGKIVKGTYDIIKNTFDIIKAFSTGDAGLLEKVTADWGAWGEVIRGVFDSVQKLYALFDKKKAEFKKTVTGSALETYDQARENRKIDFSNFNLNMNKFLENIGVFRPSSSPGDTTQTNNINVNITGNGDPVATGNAAAKAIQREINAASAQLSRNQ